MSRDAVDVVSSHFSISWTCHSLHTIHSLAHFFGTTMDTASPKSLFSQIVQHPSLWQNLNLCSINLQRVLCRLRLSIPQQVVPGSLSVVVPGGET
jgi:hypothetical protein